MLHNIHYGEELLTFTMPRGWEMLPFTPPPAVQSADLSVSELTREALDNYFAAKGPDGLISAGKSIAIVSDDGARPTPVGKMLPALFKALFERGIKKQDIDIIIGLGTHAPMGDEALLQKLGKETLQDYRVFQHDCNAKDLVPIGRLKTGTEIRINPKVAKADIRIGVGSIFPHPMNGFGGGPKIIFPGVVNYDAIREHHLAHTVNPKSIFGNINGNPFYEEIHRVAREANLNYSINCIYDTRDRVAEVLFGSFESVHKQGAEQSKKICGMTFSKKSDIALISAYPYMEPFQIMKPMIIGSLITKPGGTVMLLAKTRDQMPSSFVNIFENIQNSSRGELQDFAVGKFRSDQLLLEGAPVDFNCALFFALCCKNTFRIVIISESLGYDNIKKMGFIYYDKLKNALETERKRQPKATVNLAPVGGILPILPGDLNMGY